jgi:hypothetical protein
VGRGSFQAPRRAASWCRSPSSNLSIPQHFGGRILSVDPSFFLPQVIGELPVTVRMRTLDEWRSCRFCRPYRGPGARFFWGFAFPPRPRRPWGRRLGRCPESWRAPRVLGVRAVRVIRFNLQRLPNPIVWHPLQKSRRKHRGRQLRVGTPWHPLPWASTSTIPRPGQSLQAWI